MKLQGLIVAWVGMALAIIARIVYDSTILIALGGVITLLGIILLGIMNREEQNKQIGKPNPPGV